MTAAEAAAAAGAAAAAAAEAAAAALAAAAEAEEAFVDLKRTCSQENLFLEAQAAAAAEENEEKEGGGKEEVVTKPSVKEGMTFVESAKAEVLATKGFEEEAGLAPSKSWQDLKDFFKQAGGAMAVDVTIQVAEVQGDVVALQAAEKEEEEEE